LIQQIAVEGKEKLIHQRENHAGKEKFTEREIGTPTSWFFAWRHLHEG
jgi:hypothetical protein